MSPRCLLAQSHDFKKALVRSCTRPMVSKKP